MPDHPENYLVETFGKLSLGREMPTQMTIVMFYVRLPEPSPRPMGIPPDETIHIISTLRQRAGYYSHVGVLCGKEAHGGEVTFVFWQKGHKVCPACTEAFKKAHGA